MKIYAGPIVLHCKVVFQYIQLLYTEKSLGFLLHLSSQTVVFCKLLYTQSQNKKNNIAVSFILMNLFGKKIIIIMHFCPGEIHADSSQPFHCHC